MTRELRLPFAIWVATSAVMLALSLQQESVIFVAGIYVTLNGAALVLSILRDPPFAPTAMKVLAWCTAVQLPTMVVLIFDRGAGQGSAVEDEDDVVQDLSPLDRPSDTRSPLDRSGRPESRRTEPDPR